MTTLRTRLTTLSPHLTIRYRTTEDTEEVQLLKDLYELFTRRARRRQGAPPRARRSAARDAVDGPFQRGDVDVPARVFAERRGGAHAQPRDPQAARAAARQAHGLDLRPAVVAEQVAAIEARQRAVAHHPALP